MTERSASRRTPTPKQMEKIASKALGPAAHADPAPDAPLPDEYWEAHLSDLRAAGRPGLPIQPRRLSEIPREVLCVECARCSRCVEIQRLDAIRLFGPHAVLDHGCQVRTGRHEEDGCWPDFSY